jgi:hypothetical protein
VVELQRVSVRSRRSRPSAAPPVPVSGSAALVALPDPPVTQPAPAMPPTPAPASIVAPKVSPPVGGRPEPTREAVMTAFQHAVEVLPAAPSPPPRAVPATTVSMLARSVSRPAPAPAAPLFSPLGTVSMLSRVQTEDTSSQSAPSQDSAAAAEPPDLDVLADYVLERLRHELRDGRERLGFLLDDTL